MTEITVKDLIEKLRGMNQSAVVCGYDYDGPDGEPPHASIELCYEESDVDYINDSGDIVTGDIVVIG